MNSHPHSATWLSTPTLCCRLVLLSLLVIPGFAQAQEQSRPDLNGMWIEAISAYTDPRWRLEDLMCINCSAAAFDYIRQTRKPDDSRSFEEIQTAMHEFDKKYIRGLLTAEGEKLFDAVQSDPDPYCKPIGLLQLVRAWLAVKIEQQGDVITMDYEYLGQQRRIYLDGRDHPADLELSDLGHSIGWYDGPTLVIETTALKPNVIRSSGVVDGIRISEHATVIERITRNPDETWFDHEVTLVDPRMYREPFVVHQQRRLLEKGQEYEVYGCELVSGER